MKLPLVLMLSMLAAPALASPSSSTVSAAAGALGQNEVCGEEDEACKERARQRLEAVSPESKLGVGADEPDDLPSLGFAFFKMVLTLGVVCLLVYLSLGKLLPKLLRVQAPIAGRRIMQVVDRLPIDQRRSIMIIKTGEDLYYMVGVTEHGINLLSRIDADDIDTALATANAEPPPLGRFAQALLGRSQKES